MKGKAVVSKGINNEVICALSSPKFAESFLTTVVGGCLGVDNPLERPSEYYVQEPDVIIQAKEGYYGVEFRLTGCTRNNRTPSQFHKALVAEHELIKEVISKTLTVMVEFRCLLSLCWMMRLKLVQDQVSTQMSSSQKLSG